MDYPLPYNLLSYSGETTKKSITHHHGTWSTQNEMDYLTIDCGNSREVPRMNRIRHLERYRNAMDLRADWTTLNKEVIRNHVDKLIAQERDHKYTTKQHQNSNSLKEKTYGDN